MQAHTAQQFAVQCNVICADVISDSLISERQ